MDYKHVTLVAVQKMHAELDLLESQANRELKNRKTKNVGMLRLDLVNECRRRLLFILTMSKGSRIVK